MRCLDVRSALAVGAVLTSLSGVVGCGGSDGGPAPRAPTTVTLVARGGFHDPVDAVASPDGATFFFSALDDDDRAAVFRVASTPGSVPTPLVSAGALTAPGGLVMSCDGTTLFVASGDERAPIQTVAASGSELTAVATGGVGSIAGLAMGPDCETLYATGQTVDDEPAVFAIPRVGGEARVVRAGTPMRIPTGVYNDARAVSWVMDRLASDAAAPGVLYAVPADGDSASTVASDLRLPSAFGGVSLIAGGGVAVIGTRGADGRGSLTTFDLTSGARAEIAAPEMVAPAGLRTARDAPVFAIADGGGDAIFRAD